METTIRRVRETHHSIVDGAFYAPCGFRHSLAAKCPKRGIPRPRLALTRPRPFVTIRPLLSCWKTKEGAMKRLGIVLFFLLGSFLLGCREPEPLQPVCYPMCCQPCPQPCPQVCAPPCGSCTPIATPQPALQPYVLQPSPVMSGAAQPPPTLPSSTPYSPAQPQLQR
jgi:hypothetical protein